VRVDRDTARELPIAYAEDDGILRRIAAALWLLAHRPVATLRHLRAHGADDLLARAAAARRLAQGGAREVHALDGETTRDAATLAALAGARDG
jgi:hypothetical protein